MTVRILLVSPSSVDAYCEIVKAATGRDISAVDLTESDLRAERTSLMRRRFIACVDEQLAGYGSLAGSPFVPTDTLEAQIGVASQFRRNGVGRRLMNELESSAKMSNFNALVVSVPEGNAEALQFAESKGFAPVFDRFELELSLANEKTNWRAPQIPGVVVSSLYNANLDHERSRIVQLFADLLMRAPDMQGLPPWKTNVIEQFLFDNPATTATASSSLCVVTN